MNKASLNRINEEQLQVFERRIIRKIFGPICDNGKWRIRYNSELYSIYTDPDIIKTIKISKLRWTGHIMRMPEENLVKKLTLFLFSCWISSQTCRRYILLVFPS